MNTAPMLSLRRYARGSKRLASKLVTRSPSASKTAVNDVALKLHSDGVGTVFWSTTSLDVTDIRFQFEDGTEVRSKGSLRGDGVQGRISLPTDMQGNEQAVGMIATCATGGREVRPFRVPSVFRDELPSGHGKWVIRGTTTASLSWIPSTVALLHDLRFTPLGLEIEVNNTVASTRLELRRRKHEEKAQVSGESVSSGAQRFLFSSEDLTYLATMGDALFTLDPYVVSSDGQQRLQWGRSQLEVARGIKRFNPGRYKDSEGRLIRFRAYWTLDNFLAVEASVL